jgi:LPXTG-motif cell wall-anchored protein
MTYKIENIESLNQFVEQVQNKYKVVVLNRTVLNDGTQKYSIRLDKKGIIARLLERTNSHYVAVIVPNTDEFNSVFSKLDKDDKEAPVIEYNGQLNITLENGANFEVPEVTAKDNLDIDVTVKVVIMDSNGKVIEKIDTTKSGKYTITYTAEDESGNKAKELVITVIVNEINVDSQPPVGENKPGTPVNPEIPGQSENTEKPSEGSNVSENSGNNDLPTTGQGVYFGITIIIGIIIIGSGIFMFSKKKK